MDDFHARALKALRERHENRIRQAAATIQEEIGYLISCLDDSRATPEHYARRIATDAQEIVARFAALEAMQDATDILETRDEYRQHVDPEDKP